MIRATQRNPQGLHYHQLPEPRVLLAVGDSAFQAPTEEDITEGSDPLVMRGYILAWAHRTDMPMTIEALTDSYSMFSYLAAAHLKLPAEKGTFYHLAYLSGTAGLHSYWLIHVGGYT